MNANQQAIMERYMRPLNQRVEMSRQLAMAPVCTWTLNVDAHLYEPEFYEAECGQAYMWFDGGLEANHYHYCPNCGRPIREAEQAEAQRSLLAANYYVIEQHVRRRKSAA
jgi:transcription initiation factor IIE alpha subunit